MSKSLLYRLYFYTALLMAATAGITACLLMKQYSYAAIGLALIPFCIAGLERGYKRYNRNFLFLLDALKNGDYSFYFSETKLSTREKELNRMLNRIKEILISARREVIENENFLSLIIESVSTGIIIIDDRGIVQRVNQPALALLGLPHLSHINQLQAVNETFPSLFREIKSGDSVQITIPTEREELQISLRVSQIRLKRGMMRLLALNNIGNELEIKEMESWIRLIRVMTHEIMNSIAPITSLSEIMLSVHRDNDPTPPDNLPQTTFEVFKTIHATASGLLSFVESYRRFTSVPKPKKQDFDLRTLLDKVHNLHEPAIRESGIEMRVKLAEPIILCADESLISQVLINLVKNAIEACEPGSRETIILSADRTAAGHISVHVANSGQPIPPDILPHIFVPFFTTKSAGSGIGLSVSRYIMRLHGGKLQHTLSKEGMTVFSLVF
ncbi:MAG: PAS domain-containing protein [Prevotellaceae bacterium]|jgi:nitrogen fixation/metabolism regulation signal transduction histidine kinase|nr:PAS domain-containing protein [Prevotellaceae bacterium]